MKIGFQGEEGSNAHSASLIISGELGIECPEFIPLGNSRNAVNALKEGTANYAVMAISTPLTSVVEETENALAGLSYRIIRRVRIPIHHSLFVKDESVEKISSIASHPEALRECSGNIMKYFPGVSKIEVSDTAAAADMLKKGILGEGTAVICPMNAGIMRNLKLIRENFEDDPNNTTDFIMIELQ